MDRDQLPTPGSFDDHSKVRHGGCLCGAVRFEVRAEPLVVGVCHCLDCRKATGSVAMAYADWEHSRFTYSGEVNEFSGRSFCPACGGRVFHLGADHVEVMLGALDEGPGDLVPSREGWIIRREHWLQPVPGAAQYERDVFRQA